MDHAQVLSVLLIGGLVGAGGQVVRMIAGLKKYYEQAEVVGDAGFSASRLVISILIGFCAGLLLAIGLVVGSDPATITTKELLLGGLSAGYAGTDFIEGFMQKQSALTVVAERNKAVNKAAHGFPAPEDKPAGGA